MFEIDVLKQDKVRELTLIVTCIESPAGQEPTITLNLTDKVRLDEQKINQKHNQFIIAMVGKKQEGTVRSDKLAYCIDMVDLCVTNSARLFSEKGQPIQHKNEYLKQLLRRHPVFLNWFADALAEALKDDDGFLADYQVEQQKN